MAEFDLVIRDAIIVDGTGGVPFPGDLAIRGGRIAAVGRFAGRGVEEIDAGGNLLTPGFIDVHSHYDGQITWESRMSPSSNHGVTTVVTGNCGVGFAPCRPQDRERLVKLMEGVEDIPEVVLTEGVPWAWETFKDYADFVASREYDVDIALQVPHAALRVFVMGQRAVEREDATPDDIAAMAGVVREAMEAGAIGFGTSRTINHKASDGKLVPTLTAREEELRGIAMALAEHGTGVLQVVSDFADPEGPQAEFAMMRRLVEASGRPLSFTLQQKHSRPDGWRTLLGLVDQAAAEGLPIKAQILGRPSGVLLGHEVTLNPFVNCSSYAPLKTMPFERRIAELKRPEVRARLLAELPDAPAGNVPMAFSQLYRLVDPPQYEPFASTSIAAEAEREGRDPAEAVYDALLENGGRALLFAPAQNFATGSLDPSLEMMKNDNTIFGLGDGGAHYGVICDASVPTYMLTHWTRDRVRGEKASVPWMIRRQCRDTAAAMGLLDRGLIASGYKADLNIIDYKRLALRPPKVEYDLPAKGRRLVQESEGYLATIVNGVVTYRDGRATGSLPGGLVRGAQPAPTPH